MPRHPRTRRGPRRSPDHQVAGTPEPAAPERALVQAAIITAAALEASDDLTTAAGSLHRLGQLTSGMWRALSRELATAAERLDRQVQEHLDDLQHRAQALQVEPEAALSAGMAAGHLEEHRATLEDLLPTLPEDAQRLATPETLLGFVVAGPVLPDDDEGDEDDRGATPTSAAAVAGETAAPEASLAVQLWLFFWSAPLSPAGVTITPRFADPSTPAQDQAVSVALDVGLAAPLTDALVRAAGVPIERLPSALSELAAVCWTAHQLDEQAVDEDTDDDLTADEGDG